ncbi:kelch-like protein 3 [Amblyomma americanum]
MARSSLAVTEENVQTLLPAANLLQLSDIQEACFTENEEFLALAAGQVANLISSDRLSIPSEELVLEAVINRVNQDLANRESQLGSLMEHVRLPLLSQEYLVQCVEEEPLLKGSLPCKDFFIESMKYRLLRADQ